MTSRNARGFRFTDELIKRWTNILLAAVLVIGGIGIGLGVATESEDAPSWLGTVAAAVMIGGVVGPLLVAAVLGGESIRRGGGVIGFWAMGWIAKVPMHTGLPWAHGKVVQRDDSAPKDLIGRDEPRLRPRRPRGGSASRGPRR